MPRFCGICVPTNGHFGHRAKRKHVKYIKAFILISEQPLGSNNNGTQCEQFNFKYHHFVYYFLNSRIRFSSIVAKCKHCTLLIIITHHIITSYRLETELARLIHLIKNQWGQWQTYLRVLLHGLVLHSHQDQPWWMNMCAVRKGKLALARFGTGVYLAIPNESAPLICKGKRKWPI